MTWRVIASVLGLALTTGCASMAPEERAAKQAEAGKICGNDYYEYVTNIHVAQQVWNRAFIGNVPRPDASEKEIREAVAAKAAIQIDEEYTRRCSTWDAQKWPNLQGTVGGYRAASSSSSAGGGDLGSGPKTVYVQGHSRGGTHVAAHYRSTPSK